LKDELELEELIKKIGIFDGLRQLVIEENPFLAEENLSNFHGKNPK